MQFWESRPNFIGLSRESISAAFLDDFKVATENNGNITSSHPVLCCYNERTRSKLYEKTVAKPGRPINMESPQ